MPSGTMYRTRVVLTGVAGSPYYLTAHFVATGGTAQQAADAWMTFVAGATSGTGGGYPAPAVLTSDGNVDLIDPATDTITGSLSVTQRTFQGSGSADTLPPATQLLVRWRTGNYVGGREIRGRTFIPLLAETSSDQQGRPIPAVTSGFDTRGAALIADPNSQHCVYSKKNGVWEITSGASTWSQFAVLRSRRD